MSERGLPGPFCAKRPPPCYPEAKSAYLTHRGVYRAGYMVHRVSVQHGVRGGVHLHREAGRAYTGEGGYPRVHRGGIGRHIGVLRGLF